MQFRFKRSTYFLLITTMIVPVPIILVPLLPWFRTLGLTGSLSSPHLAQENLAAAGSILAILPPMLLFVMLNRYYGRGLFAGATKG